MTRTWKATGHGLRNGYADQRKTPIQDTLEGVDLDTTSWKIDVNIETAFNTRHRLICIMEKELENEVLAGEVELDETFVGASRKSFSMEDDAGFEMAADRGKRGLLKQKVCIPAESMEQERPLFKPTIVAGSDRPLP